jgi:hypothetical protein
VVGQVWRLGARKEVKDKGYRTDVFSGSQEQSSLLPTKQVTPGMVGAMALSAAGSSFIKPVAVQQA